MVILLKNINILIKTNFKSVIMKLVQVRIQQYQLQLKKFRKK